MTAANGLPEWIPVDRIGRHWTFVSFKGRLLGRVLKLHVLGGGMQFLASRNCCNASSYVTSLREAKRYIEGTLNCVPCAQRITKAALDWDARNSTRTS